MAVNSGQEVNVLTEQKAQKPAPHAMKQEIRDRGFTAMRLAVRCGQSYWWLTARLNGISTMTPEDEALIRRAMEPDAESPGQPAVPA